MRRINLHMAVTACIVMLFVSAASLASADPLQAIRPAKISGGIVLLPRVTEPALPLELARDGRFLVYTQTWDPGQAPALKTEAAVAGVLAKTLYVADEPLAGDSLAGNSVSLLYLDDLVDADLNAGNRELWLGFLSPERGIAIPGNPKAGTLDSEKLKSWLAGMPGLEIFSDATGVWAKCRRAAPPDSAPWTHKFYSPANTRLPRDIHFKPPLLPAWYGLPLHLGYWGETLVSQHGLTQRVGLDPADG